MKKNSSNDAMEQVFKQLANIQKVESSTDLYDSIRNSINKPQLISMVWVRAAAAVLLIFCTFELLLVKKEMDSNARANQLQALVPQTQNVLYND